MPETKQLSSKVKLSIKQRGELLKIKRTHKSSIVRDRAQAVLARDNGLTIANIAKAISRDPKFIRKAVNLYQGGKLTEIKLTSNNHKLSAKKRKEIIKIIQSQCPNKLKGFKFKEQFWTIDILRVFLNKKYQIEYQTTKSYYDLFKQAGFAFKKPKTRDFRQNPLKVKEFKGALKKSSTTTRIRLSW